MNEKYMKIAIKEAEKAYKIGELPVGCIIVENDKILSKGYNKKEKNKNVLEHAELVAIKKTSKLKKDWRLNDCILYTTFEPCVMCMGAIIECKIKHIVCGSINTKYHDINKKLCEENKISIEYNVNNETTNLMLKNFFNDIRNKLN